MDAQQRAQVDAAFAVSAGAAVGLEDEQAQHGDMALLNAVEGYGNLWRKVLVYMQELQQRGRRYHYFMHADDDSYVRLDLLIPLLESSPRQRFYWGYIWDGTGNRVTAPIRNPANKSHMPEAQYPYTSYPPFASGCGFVLSWDLVEALLSQPLPDYRLLDPPFGIHLCGGERCVLEPPVVPVHDHRVRPYRGLPMFHPDTIVQHYLRPEEMRPFHSQAMEALAMARQQQQDTHSGGGTVGAGRGVGSGSGAGAGGNGAGSVGEHGVGSSQGPAEALYATLIQMGILRR